MVVGFSISQLIDFFFWLFDSLVWLFSTQQVAFILALTQHQINANEAPYLLLDVLMRTSLLLKFTIYQLKWCPPEITYYIFKM